MQFSIVRVGFCLQQVTKSRLRWLVATYPCRSKQAPCHTVLVRNHLFEFLHSARNRCSAKGMHASDVHVVG